MQYKKLKKVLIDIFPDGKITFCSGPGIGSFAANAGYESIGIIHINDYVKRTEIDSIVEMIKDGSYLIELSPTVIKIYKRTK